MRKKKSDGHYVKEICEGNKQMICSAILEFKKGVPSVTERTVIIYSQRNQCYQLRWSNRDLSPHKQL
jgi:hypothetical protein